jgi:hypothetical protein
MFLAKHSIPLFLYLPYSPYLPCCNFFLFPMLKITQRRKRFKDTAELNLMQLGTCRPFQNMPMKHTFESE